jgi:GTP-binding protein EngB required for normal cell division
MATAVETWFCRYFKFETITAARPLVVNPGLGLFLSFYTKQILVLGQSSLGKSTLVSAFLQRKALSDDQKDTQKTDFAIGYDFADVRDEAKASVAVCKLQATLCSMESIRHSCSIVCA